jgi:hypothetical protein
MVARRLLAVQRSVRVERDTACYCLAGSAHVRRDANIKGFWQNRNGYEMGIGNV